MSIKRWEFYCIGMHLEPIDPNVEHGIGVREYPEGSWSTPYVKHADHAAEVERERAIRREAIRDNREKTEAVRKLEAEVARLTADLAEARAQAGIWHDPITYPPTGDTKRTILVASVPAHGAWRMWHMQADALRSLMYLDSRLLWSEAPNPPFAALPLVTVARIHPTGPSGNATPALARAERFGAAHRAALAALPTTPKEEA